MITYDILSRIELEEATEFLTHKLPSIDRIDLVIQLGSGQRPENLLDEVWARVPLQEMPGIPKEKSLARHQLEVIWGICGNIRVLIFAGRFHLYEGYGRIPCILPVWVAVECGARNFLFSNSAAAINERMAPGSFMIFKDHINNFGVSPLAGHQHLLRYPYIDMSQTYTSKFASSFLRVASSEPIAIHQGVYMAYMGPQLETPAEINYAKMAGVDAVGMSTVLEATTAYALRARVMAISMIKNTAPGIKRGKISQRESVKIGKSSSKVLISTIRKWLNGPAQSVLQTSQEDTPNNDTNTSWRP